MLVHFCLETDEEMLTSLKRWYLDLAIQALDRHAHVASAARSSESRSIMKSEISGAKDDVLGIERHTKIVVRTSCT